jgi:acyl-lipid omega-6 desaturase (Delta-12 desaturase)
MGPPALEREALQAFLRPFAAVDEARGASEVASTLVAHALALSATGAALAGLRSATEPAGALAWGLALAGSTAVLALSMVRAFLVHHDLCHGALFRSARTRRALAVVLGALCSTSPRVWTREHDRHHRDSNNLDRPQDGQTAPWTVARYLAAPPWQRAAYRALGWRPVLFGLVPPLYFLGFMRLGATAVENLVFLAWVLGLWALGLAPAFLLGVVPAAAFGFLLFHAQHTFPGAVRRRAADWDFFENGLRGSSILVLPPGRALRWCLYGVGVHALHHLHPAIPGYQLEPCLVAGGERFAEVPRVTLAGAWRDARLALYDEARGRLVRLEEVRPP